MGILGAWLWDQFTGGPDRRKQQDELSKAQKEYYARMSSQTLPQSIAEGQGGPLSSQIGEQQSPFAMEQLSFGGPLPDSIAAGQTSEMMGQPHPAQSALGNYGMVDVADPMKSFSDQVNQMAMDSFRTDIDNNRFKGGILKRCCFIFIEAQNGLHPVVRRYRDEHMTDRNRRGYYRLSDWLVPRMRKCRIMKRAVQLTMTTPLIEHGKWFYGYNRFGVIFKPVYLLWMAVFNLLGLSKPYVRKNGEQV